MAPDLVESKVTDDGVVVPFGKPKEEPSKKVCAVREQQLYFLTKITSHIQSTKTHCA
jgi:hypothetical protein